VAGAVGAIATGPEQFTIVSPCGPCRQMLFDLDPDIRAVVRTKIGPPEAVPVRDFLSYVSDWRAVEPDVSQRQYVWEDRLEDIRADRWTARSASTIPRRQGGVSWVFDHDADGIVTTLLVEVIKVVEGRSASPPRKTPGGTASPRPPACTTPCRRTTRGSRRPPKSISSASG